MCVNRILKLASVQHELRLSGFELEGSLQSGLMSSEVVPESAQPASAADTLAGLDKTSCDDLPLRFFFFLLMILDLC